MEGRSQLGGEGGEKEGGTKGRGTKGGCGGVKSGGGLRVAVLAALS